MSESASPFPNDGRLIPIVLGIVGHRDLPTDEKARGRLEAALGEVFQEFDDAYPKSPKILLSPLSPGADQLGARVALKRRLWSVRAPLAFDPEIFLQSTSFQTEDGRGNKVLDTAAQDSFRQLLTDPRVESFVVPLPPDKQRTSAEWKRIAGKQAGEPDEDKNLRRACYANPGGYIVRHCHTLIALWDEEKATRPSGTAEIVRFQLRGLPPELYPWADTEPLGFSGDRGPVIVLHTPRASKASARTGRRTVLVPSEKDVQSYGEPIADLPRVARPLSRTERFGERARHWLNLEPRRGGLQEYNQFLAICQTIEDFNAEAKAIPPGDAGYASRMQEVDEDVDRNFPAADPPDPLRPNLRDWYKRIVRLRETTAHLPARLSPTHTRLGFELFVMLFVVLLTFHIYAHPIWHTDPASPGEHPWVLLALFEAGWLVMAVLVAWVWWVRLEERRMDYRALAEALRVRRAWALGGINRGVSRSYLSQLRSEVTWVRRALDHLCPPSWFWQEQFDRLSAERKAARLLEVQVSWVKQQERHYHREAEKEHAKACRYRVLGFGLALLSLIGFSVFLILGLVLGESAHGNGPGAWLNPNHPRPELFVVGSLLLVLGGLLIALCERRAHEELAKQYERMHVVFRNGARELAAALATAPPDMKRIRAILIELGREAIQENAQWLLLRRSKPLELPLGA